MIIKYSDIMKKVKFLTDVNLEESFVKLLIESKYDVIQISEIDCFMKDEEIIKLGLELERVIITEDKDFGEKTFKEKIICFGIVLIRVVNKDILSLENRINRLSELLEFQSENLISNFTVISETKIRINKL